MKTCYVCLKINPMSKSEVIITLYNNGHFEKCFIVNYKKKSIDEIIQKFRQNNQEYSTEFAFSTKNQGVHFRPYLMDIDSNKLYDGIMKFSEYAKKWYSEKNIQNEF